ncbi:hypothetical protein WR25_07826 [Diploscapter pachys]|uniref:Uncharacterized protein n=1 Tax=Diploscapter pachys TaxID=2018661 RepID=A0A2A2JFK2_9BILA|nr:hypothetical protein WR25_07826 [Diploscapter pachys]
MFFHKPPRDISTNPLTEGNPPTKCRLVKEETQRKRQLKEKLKRLCCVLDDEEVEIDKENVDEDKLMQLSNVVENCPERKIGDISKQTRKSRIVDLCFLHVRLGFVAYRDFGDKSSFQVRSFNGSVVDFLCFCDNLEATGGDDAAEDVFTGLEKAINLDWSEDSGTKIIFHIADRPCHGREFHSYSRKSDNYPDGDPFGRTHTDLFRRIRLKGIQYYFGRISNQTDIMVEKFSEAYGDTIQQFDVAQYQKMRDSVITAVSTSINASISDCTLNSCEKRKLLNFNTNLNEPD